MLNMKNNHALITGGSRGLGRAIALKFASEGMDIGIIGRDRSGLEETKLLVEKHGQQCHIIQADLSLMDEVQRASEEALAISDTWSVLVNNAGVAKQQSLREMPLADWELIHNVNIKAVFLLSRNIVECMIAQKRGKVVNISSLGAFFGTHGLGAYGASKAALNQLTRTMAVEWGPHNIQVNAICPTVVMTDMGKSIWEKPENDGMRKTFLDRIPAGKFGEPEDVAELAWFMASPASNYLNGVSIPLDGGKTVKP